MDIDTILYIGLIIIMLIVSGISSRRKKQAQQMKKPVPGTGQQGTEEPGITGTKARTLSMDPFERLEQGFRLLEGGLPWQQGCVNG